MEKTNKNPQIIAIVGMAGAGKSCTCEFLKKAGFAVLRFGDQTDIGVKELGLPLTEDNERKYREDLRKQYGMAAYAIKIEPRIKNSLKGNSKIALDGLYSWEEYVFLKKKFPKLILLCIYAHPEIRYRRLLERKIRSLDQKKAVGRDIAEIVNLHKGGPIAIADYLVQNNSSIKKLHRELKNFLENLK